MPMNQQLIALIAAYHAAQDLPALGRRTVKAANTLQNNIASFIGHYVCEGGNLDD